MADRIPAQPGHSNGRSSKAAGTVKANQRPAGRAGSADQAGAAGRSGSAGAAGPTAQERSDAEVAELCRILLGVDSTQVAAMLERFGDRGEFTEFLGEVLGDAMRLGAKRDDRLGHAIAPLVTKGVHETVRRDPAQFGEVLAPAMGPAIRQSVRQMLEGLVESFERTIELSVSPKSLKWRIEAWRTGRPFAEVILLHTLQFRVEQVFWIHRKTGLLLQHASRPLGMARADGATGDADVVSAMLTAIQDFVRDAFETKDDETLRSFQVGDFTVWVEQGNHSVLATVIRGQAPRNFRAELRGALERMELAMAERLVDFDGEVDPFEAVIPDLEACLVERRRDDVATDRAAADHKPRKTSRRALLAALAVVAVVGLSIYLWIDWRRQVRFESFLEALDAAPGIQVVDATRSGLSVDIRGLRDPLAADPLELAKESGLASADTDLSINLDTYFAGDATIAVRRLSDLVGVPSTAEFVISADHELAVDGAASHAWIERVRTLAPLVPGIGKVSLTGLVDLDRETFSKALERVQDVFVPLPPEGDELDASELLEAFSAELMDVARLASRSGQTLTLRCAVEGVSGDDAAEAAAFARRVLRRLRAEVPGLTTTNPAVGVGQAETGSASGAAAPRGGLRLEVLPPTASDSIPD